MTKRDVTRRHKDAKKPSVLLRIFVPSRDIQFGIRAFGHSELIWISGFGFRNSAPSPSRQPRSPRGVYPDNAASFGVRRYPGMNHRMSTRFLISTVIVSLLLALSAAAQETPATAPATRPAPGRRNQLSPNIRPAVPPTARPVEAVKHAIVVSIDGLRPDLMLEADTPNLHSLMQRGCYSMWARTTPNSITLPSH